MTVGDRTIPICYLKIIKSGYQVWYEGRPYTVKYNSIINYEMYAMLNGLEKIISFDKLSYPLTAIDLNRHEN